SRLLSLASNNIGLPRTVAEVSFLPDLPAGGAPCVVGIHSSGLPEMVAPCSNTPAMPYLWKMTALACSEGSPPSVAPLVRYCKPDCHCALVNPAPAAAILLRPSCTDSAATSRRAATAAVATGRCLSRIILSQAGVSTVTLSLA